jgi:hypothetical protein
MKIAVFWVAALCSLVEVYNNNNNNNYNNNNKQWHYSPDWRKPPLIQFYNQS